MHPILFNFGKLTIYTYGFMLAVGFSVGILYARYEVNKAGEDMEKIMDLIFYVIIAGIVGARLFYVATNLQTFLADPIEVFRIWNGGLVFYGGFIVALITALSFIKMKKMDMWKLSDIAGPTMALGHSISRIGCFFAGCCYGQRCDLPWAVTFNHPKSLAPLHISIHPTQIYSSINLFFIFCILLLLRPYKKFDGQIFWTYILLYGLSRSVIELFRGDPRGDFVMNIFSVSQTIGMGMSCIAISMLIFLGKRASLQKD